MQRNLLPRSTLMKATAAIPLGYSLLVYFHGAFRLGAAHFCGGTGDRYGRVFLVRRMRWSRGRSGYMVGGDGIEPPTSSV